MPIVDEKAPTEADFEAMLSSIRASSTDTAFVFNCQVQSVDPPPNI